MCSDDAYASEPKLRDLPFNFKTVLRWPLLLLIRFYQKVISPGIPGNTCRFYPSCSHYSYQAIYKYGVWKGGALSVWRILRCNPFNDGGYDPVPERTGNADWKKEKDDNNENKTN